MQVRDLAWEDFRDITENYYSVYEEVKADPEIGIGLFPDRPPLSAEGGWFSGLFGRVQDGKSVAVVVEKEGRVAGMCQVDPKGPVAEVHHIGVLGILVGKPYRGQGIGRALLAGALERCRGKFELVELSVFSTNRRARELYERSGFRCWGTLPDGVKRGERYIDLDHMVADLRTPKASPPLSK